MKHSVASNLLKLRSLFFFTHMYFIHDIALDIGRWTLSSVHSFMSKRAMGRVSFVSGLGLGLEGGGLG